MNHPSHRIIWEAINQKMIPDGYQIHHRDSNKVNNEIDNLELVTRKENMIYAAQKRRGKTHSKKQNISMKSKEFYYHHIDTNFGANEYGQIYNKKTKRVSIGNLRLNGYFYITLSQIGLPWKHYYVHRLVHESFHGPITEGYEINHIDSNRQNNCLNNLELVTHSENVQHSHEAKKYKTKIEITSDQPIELIKLDIKMKESDDYFTEDEKQLIDKKYNAMMKKVKNGDFLFRTQLQTHFPNVKFW